MNLKGTRRLKNYSKSKYEMENNIFKYIDLETGEIIPIEDIDKYKIYVDNDELVIEPKPILYNDERMDETNFMNSKIKECKINGKNHPEIVEHSKLYEKICALPGLYWEYKHFNGEKLKRIREICKLNEINIYLIIKLKNNKLICYKNY